MRRRPAVRCQPAVNDVPFAASRSRREWMKECLAWLAGTTASGVLPRSARGAQAPAAEQIDTVRGRIDAAQLGLTLIHEHVLVDFAGADIVSPSRYNADDAFNRVLPHLHQLKALGASSLIECTPAYLGRDPRLLRRLSEASGLHLLTNTGYYGANKGRHLPPHAFTETAEQLAARWVREWEHGIDDTGVRPAFMKIGVDAGALSPVNATLIRAAAIAHRLSRLPIASHTGRAVAAFESLDLLDAANVPASAFIWVHAQAEPDVTRHAAAAARGAWVSFDGISDTSVEQHVRLVRSMMEAGHLDRVLVSHDAGWYHVGEPDGGTFRPFDTLFTQFIPALKVAGASDADVRSLLVDNPRRAFGSRS